MGFLVKLDSNGTLPEMLEHLLREELLDYVAIDIRTLPHGMQKPAVQM